MKREEFLKQYQTKDWYNISQRIKVRDKNTCQMCGCNDKPLSVHHLYYPLNENITDIDDKSLITLCVDCHNLQREYKDRINGYISDLRSVYTDYEICCVLKALIDSKIEAILDNNPRLVIYADDCTPPDEERYMKNLINWHKKIYNER